MARFEDKSFAPTTWSVVASQTDATATATKAAEASRTHYITGISFSMSAQPGAAAVVQVLNGATVIDQFQIPAAAQAPFVHNYTPPIAATEGNAVSITVGALGTGVVGTVVIKGKTFSGT